jgi:lysozyme
MSFRTKALGGIAAAGIAGSAAFIAPWEGLETKPYQDMGGVMTVCYGETNVDMREYSEAECEAMLRESVAGYYNHVSESVTYDVPLSTRIAFTSFAYNVGLGAFDRSTLLKKANSGDLWGACVELERWSYVGRMWVRGLSNRRKMEKELCLIDLKEGL